MAQWHVTATLYEENHEPNEKLPMTRVDIIRDGRKGQDGGHIACEVDYQSNASTLRMVAHRVKRMIGERDPQAEFVCGDAAQGVEADELERFMEALS